jgi:hypothetical protein
VFAFGDLKNKQGFPITFGMLAIFMFAGLLCTYFVSGMLAKGAMGWFMFEGTYSMRYHDVQPHLKWLQFTTMMQTCRTGLETITCTLWQTF